ncbi:NAD(P)/FAD-dependent oxidoreductase [uncultured Clostridium sp.]|jgi:thioredoxin reductase (NADPH)|uniref:NAD(P)/FAD-dependent oxidoreductase n=1 Tax=uncultured Clostridium sp. TaxID=59620 RepID=UPI00260E2DB4|nr:NAD(P)/FAD-dependent oxidoreductase [uncultured Clostridium sp.]
MSNQGRFDIAIIGSGPAGLSAALNAKIRNKKFIIFGSKNLSAKIEKAPKIDNYLGFFGMTGKEIGDKFKEHIASMDIEITEKRIDSVYAMGNYFALMSNNETIEATSVIIASGIEYTKPIKGEEEFLGRGVGYCATCDAPLYKEKIVSIVGYNKEAEEEAEFVSELASKVYYIPMYKTDFSGNEKIEIINSRPVEVQGAFKANKLILKDRELETDGIFFLKDSISPGQLVPGLKIENGHIEVDRTMKTNIKGCFAAGDCVGKPYQYIKAAGEGNIAALSAASYLANLDKENSK